MSDQASSFAGTIPTQYDTKLGPMLFEPYARAMAERVPATATRVLETAAGTGIVARHLLARLGPEATLVVTDVQEGMLDVARPKLARDPRAECRTADATALPFADRRFDVVVCQFGLMFFADKALAVREARRVLTPDGTFVLSTWASLADNPIARITHEALGSALPDLQPFESVAFDMHDAAAVTDLLHGAGFGYVRSEVLSMTAESESAHHAATGLICGSPMLLQLQERGVTDPRTLVDVVAARLADEGGLAPLRLPMQALFFTAQ